MRVLHGLPLNHEVTENITSTNYSYPMYTYNKFLRSMGGPSQEVRLRGELQVT